MSQILHPGEYFIELEFDRPVDPAVLHKALTSMGFGVVVFDQSLPAVQVGALATTMARARTSTASAAPVASRLAAVSAPLPTAPVANRLSAVSVSIPVATVASKLSTPIQFVTAPPVPVPAALHTPGSSGPAPARPPAPAPTVVAIQSRYAKLASDATVALADRGMSAALKPASASISPNKMTVKPAFPGDPAASVSATDLKTDLGVKTDGTVTTGPAQTSVPFPGDTSSPAADKTPFVASSDGGGGGSATAPSPEPPQYDPQEAQPYVAPAPVVPGVALPASVSVTQVLTDLWTRWKEWGSPFASGPPQQTTKTGSVHDDDPLRFRVLARLDRPISLDDRPGMRWLFVKALSFPFLADLSYQSHPHTLRKGNLYELRFLSRAKSNPTRDSVKQGLSEMGFLPVKLLAFKRNMNLPRRPASLTLWYGMAVWNRADSVIINDDPFFFETVKEIRPL